MFDIKSSQIARTFLQPFLYTFGLAYSPLNSATLNCSSEVTLWKGSSLGEHWKAEHPGSDFVFQIFSQSLRLSRLTRKTDKKAKKFCNTSNLQ